MNSDFYKIKTAASELPVTKVEAKAWCKVTHTSEDDLFNSLIAAATAKAELFTNRVFVQRTFTGSFSGFECSKFDGVNFTLRRAPFISLTSVKVMVDDVLETISTDDYNMQEEHGFSRIIFTATDESPDDIPYPYQVEFVAGYGAASAVPEPIKTAILETICYWHKNRGDCGEGSEIPGIAKGILGEFRILNTYG